MVTQSIDCDDICNIWFIVLYSFLGEFEKAEQYIKRLEEEGEPLYRPTIGYVYHKLGRLDEAEEVFQACIKNYEYLTAKNKHTALVDYRLARIHAFQNRKHEALQSMKVIGINGFNFDMFDRMNHDPMFENLWDDPEFKAIIKKAQDEKAEIRTQIREMEESKELDL